MVVCSTFLVSADSSHYEGLSVDTNNGHECVRLDTSLASFSQPLCMCMDVMCIYVIDLSGRNVLVLTTLVYCSAIMTITFLPPMTKWVWLALFP